MPLSSEPPNARAYNSLPLINNGTAPPLQNELDALGDIIRKHGLEDHFGLHLVHRHFAIPDEHVLASVLTNDGCEVHVPVPKSQLGESFEGVHFMLTPEGQYRPFEFAPKSKRKDGIQQQQEDVTPDPESFLTEFTARLRQMQLADTIALTIADKQSQREVVGDAWTVHYHCEESTAACRAARTIATGWRCERGVPGVIECTNWHPTGNDKDNNHRTSPGPNGTPALPRIDDGEAAGEFVGFLRAQGVICCGA